MKERMGKPFDPVELRVACAYWRETTVRDPRGKRLNSRRKMEYRPRATGGYFWFGCTAINEALGLWDE